jgi:hypothetical protein
VGAGNPIAPARPSLRVINLVKLLEFKVDCSPLIEEGLLEVMKRKRLDLPMIGIVASSCSSTKATLSYKMPRRIKRC